MNIEAPFAQTGYGYCAYNIVKNIRLPNVTVFPISGKINSEFKGIETLCNLATYVPNAASFKIWHEYDLIRRIGRGKYGALTFFEINDLDEKRVASMNTPDVLMVPTKWAKGICDERHIESHVVPMGVDRDIFKVEPFVEHERDIFKVLNCGKWEIRKGHDILGEVFAEAFRGHKDVRLELMTSNMFLKPEEVLQWKNHYKQTVGADRVVFHENVNSHFDVARIINQNHIGIFPSRAEGWNMEALEMLSCAKHIIITNYSAHTEYCTPENSSLIEIDNLEPAFDGKWFNGQFKWAEIEDKQKKDMVAALRDLYDKWRAGDTLFNMEGVLTAMKYSWRRTAMEIEDLLLDK